MWPRPLLLNRKSRQRPAITASSTRNTHYGGSTTADVEILNDALVRLLEIYPDHDRGLCRRTLATKVGKPLLEAAADALAETDTSSNGVLDGQLPMRPRTLEPWERFRTEPYKASVSKFLGSEFKNLRASTIKAVLAENNYDYARSRDGLSEIASRSWRVSVLSLFSWRSSRNSSESGPSGPSTGCPELDEEIDLLHNGDKRKEQVNADAEFARALNEEEYRIADTLYECECCFGDFAWEDICFCSNFHYFCRRCLQRSVTESLYGQGSGLDICRASVRCISSMPAIPCTATVSPSHLPHFLPPEIVSALEDHFSKGALDKSGIVALRCPFCPYAVLPADQYYTWDGTFLGVLSYLWSWFWWWLSLSFPPDIRQEWDKLAWHHHRPQWETILRCVNPRCLRSSCLQCRQEWVGTHNCSKDEADSKRAYVARRMDEALKRTCPRCNTSFVKDGGCNRMKCICGYKMCYICRADVNEEEYDHYCKHFRLNPGTACTECERCSLFQNEVEDQVLQAAKVRAEAQWEAQRTGNGPRILISEDIPGSGLRGWRSTLFSILSLCAGYS